MKIQLTFTTFLLFLIVNSSAFAQTPCVNGMAGDYPCSGYDLISFLSIDELGITANGNDCWGWTDPLTSSEYAIMCGNNRTVFIDISNPVEPVILGHLPSQTGSVLWRDAKVYNDHVFIVSEAASHGMQVFDLTRLRDLETIPTSFNPDAHYDGVGSIHNLAINEETGYAYPVGGGSFAGGPKFVNIQDPINPFGEGGFEADGFCHDAQVVIYNGPDEAYVGKEILFGFNTNSLTIVDVTDKFDPIQISRTEYDQSVYTHQGWIDDSHTRIFMNDEIDEVEFGFNTRTLVMDITNLEMPILAHEHFGPTTGTDHNMYVREDKLFQSTYKSGLRVMQINEDPENPLEDIGFFDCYPPNDEPGWDAGTWSNYPYFDSENIILSAYDGFYVLRASIPSGLEETDIKPFELFPNPTNETLNIQALNSAPIESYVITDVAGRVVLSEEGLFGLTENLKIDVRQLKLGSYLVTINNDQTGVNFVKN